MLRRVASIEMSGMRARLVAAIDRETRTGYDATNTRALRAASNEAEAITHLRGMLYTALRRQVATPDEVALDGPVVEAIVRISRHVEVAPIESVPLEPVHGGPDLGPRLRGAYAWRPRPWDKTAVVALLVREIQTRHGGHTVNDGMPPWLMVWGPATAIVRALFTLWAFDAAGLLPERVDTGDTMLAPRSHAEAHLYVELHPCDCGTATLAAQNRTITRDDGLLCVYEGGCGSCGKARRFEFVLDEPLSPSSGPLVYGGEEPSTIIDAGQFLWLAERYAKPIPADVAALVDSERPSARQALEVAVAALTEVVKFIPPDANTVPSGAYFTEHGRTIRDRQPDRFQRDWLIGMLEQYRRMAERLRELGS